MNLWSKSRTAERGTYDALQGEEEYSSRDTSPPQEKPSQSLLARICKSIILPWSISAFLLVALAIVSLGHRNPLGSYESGFVTDIDAVRPKISLTRKKFHAGVNIDAKGSYSLTKDPHGPDFFAPPSPEVDALWMDQMLLNSSFAFMKLTPKEVEKSGLTMLPGDLLEDGTYAVQPSAVHSLHCLNYIRKSLARDYYTDITDAPERPYHMSHRMHLGQSFQFHLFHSLALYIYIHTRSFANVILGRVDHCLENIRQHLTCSFDLTWTPRAWRPEARVFHADTDQWHVCRDFDKLMDWMRTRI
ncbi:hypothetical protein PSV08DRAFT_410020 [Bipolaris maydis]|uniref:uncharacterized protein n=1 Tax=Cochliobolus heterostrophus TaxID=5016 RepID=UPI0024D3A4EF|nr:hypothetical protein PSV08DRAFT_410020 [Bipolaris maydis]